MICCWPFLPSAEGALNDDEDVEAVAAALVDVLDGDLVTAILGVCLAAAAGSRLRARPAVTAAEKEMGLVASPSAVAVTGAGVAWAGAVDAAVCE